jgi:hypothetical protein
MILTIDAEKSVATDIEPAPEELVAEEPCPLCEKHRDPVTGELRFNAETIAAFEEGDAMERGEIPVKWYNSAEEMWADLDADDEDD